MRRQLSIVLDTNIILDHVMRREGFYELARKVCLLGITGEASTFVPVNILTDLFYLLKKDLGSTLAQEMLEQNISYLQPVAVTPEDARQALSKRWSDFEDCLLAQCASKIKADYIITRNTKDYKQSAVPAITPEQLFTKLEAAGFSYAQIDF